MSTIKKRIGIVGGGQLGKMMILEAKRLGFYVVTLDPSVDCPSSSISDELIVSPLNNETAYYELADKVDEEGFRFIRDMFEGDDYGKKFGIYEENYVNGKCLNLTTLAPTVIGFKNGFITLTVNSRTAYGKTNAEIIAAFEKAGEEYGFTTDIGESAVEPIYVDYKLDFLQLMKKIYDDIMGVDSDFILAYGTSYAKALPNFVSFGPLLPGEPDTAHQADENLAIDKIILAGEIYEAFIRAVMMSGRSFKV